MTKIINKLNFIVFCITISFSTGLLHAQDVIIRNNGEEIQTKIEEVGVTEIRYKRFTNQTGPTFTILKSDVFMIIYENGTRDVFERSAATQSVTSQQQSAIQQSTTIQQGATQQRTTQQTSATQMSNVALGGHFSAGRAETFGIGAKFRYKLANSMRLEGSFTHFFPKEFSLFGISTSTSMWDLSINGNYLMPINDKNALYLLAGPSIISVTTKVSYLGNSERETANSVGFNIGSGFDLKITDNIVLNSEFKYTFITVGSRWNISIGIMFNF